MKQRLVVLLLLAIAVSASALELSAGGSISLGTFSSTYYYENLGVVDSYDERSTTVPFAFTGYVDATYGLAAIGFRANGNTRQSVTYVTFGTTVNPPLSDDNYRSGFVSFSALGKYPFALGPVTIFPLAGIEYDLMLYYLDETGAAMSTEGLDQFWFKLGVGSDIKIHKGLYVRPLVLVGLKLLNADEKKRIQDTLDAGATVARTTDFLFEGGVQVGWRF